MSAIACLHWQGLNGKNALCLILPQSCLQGCLCSQSLFWVIAWIWLQGHWLSPQHSPRVVSQYAMKGCPLLHQVTGSVHCWLLLGFFFYSFDLKAFCQCVGIHFAWICYLQSCREQELSSKLFVIFSGIASGCGCWCFLFMFWLTRALLSNQIWRYKTSLSAFPSQISCLLHTAGWRKLLSEKLYLI